jgi:hypothetical protein
MRLLVETALLTCDHAGRVDPQPSQRLVFVNDRRVLVKPDVEAKSITACPIPLGPGSKPCTNTLPLRKGYSRFVFIQDIPVCREDARGYTDGVPPGGVDYFVVQPAQRLTAEEA